MQHARNGKNYMKIISLCGNRQVLRGNLGNRHKLTIFTALPGYQRTHLIIRREVTRLVLRIGERAVDGNVENTAAPFHQFDFGIGKGRQDVPRTAGPRFVVSGYAVFDFDFHRVPVSFECKDGASPLPI